MIVVDASVWISLALPGDANYRNTIAWATHLFDQNIRMSVPSLFLVEFGAAISRRTQSPERAREGVARIERDPVFEIVELDRRLISASAEAAITFRLRGADAVYVALAQQLDIPLISWDREQLDRTSLAVDVLTPSHALARWH